MFFFRMIFPHRWCGLQLFCSFWTVQKSPNFFTPPPASAISLFAEPKHNGLSCRVVCFSSASQILQFFLKHMKAWQGYMQKNELWSTDMSLQNESLFYLNTEPAPWGWSEDETTYEWVSVAEHRKDKRPLDWHHTAGKSVIKGHSLIAVAAKECWHEQEYSSQGTCLFISCSCILAPSSFFFRLHYILLPAFPAPSLVSFSFSVQHVCHSFSLQQNCYLCGGESVCLSFSLSLFLSLFLISLCLVSHEQMSEQRVHRNHLPSSTEHTLAYKRSGMAQFWEWVHLDWCRSGQIISWSIRMIRVNGVSSTTVHLLLLYQPSVPIFQC